jgi:hypothetical protein
MASYTPKAALILLVSVTYAHSQWVDEIGYSKLHESLKSYTPDGTGTRMSQIEAGGANRDLYAPVSGSGNIGGTVNFRGITFGLKSGVSGDSYHAKEVGAQCYGKPGGSRTGMAPGVGLVDNYEVNSWLDGSMLRYRTLSAPKTELSDVVNHSWIYDTSPNDAALNHAIRLNDFSVTRDDYLCVVGMGLDPTKQPNILLASGFNVLSVGVSSGAHSRGLTHSTVDGGGRMKPEIVAPADFTSFSTPIVSAAGLLMKQVGNRLVTAGAGLNATNHLTHKAVLLAGATKEPFPNWSRTPTRPIDAIFGVGQLNVWTSYTILTGGEQTPSSSAPAANNGWDHGSSTTTRDYLLYIPSTLAGSQLSAVLTWDRTFTTSSGATFTATPNELPDLSLTLEKRATVGAGYTGVDSSNSPVDNLEHVYRKSLTSGTYRLRVSPSANTPYALAWRVTPPEAPTKLNLVRRGSNLQFVGNNLVEGQPYTLESSTDLKSWIVIGSFTGSSSSQTVATFSISSNAKRFFRLSW